MASAIKRSAGLVLAWALLAGQVAAHATLVFGTLTSDPAVPQAGKPFTLTVAMSDPTDIPVEDAVVVAEFTHTEGSETVSLELSESSPGIYEGNLTLPEEGSYALLLRDQTFRQEEARAELEVTLQADAPLFVEGDNTVIFPPTATAQPNTVRTWLIWVVVLPILAGIAVTIMVLRGSAVSDEA